MNKLIVECIKNDNDFKKLKTTWDELLSVSSVEDITLTWEWLYTWWEVFKEGRELWLLLIYENQEIVGIAPLLKRTVKYYGILPFRRIELLGTGEDEKDEICSDYLDFIVESGREKEVAKAIFDYLISKSDEWDELYFGDFLENSKNIQHLFNHLRQNKFSIDIIKRMPCPYIDLPSEWGDLVKKTKNRKIHIKKKSKLLEKQGEIEYLIWPKGSSHEEAFEKMINLHQSRWVAQGKKGCFASKKFTTFHKNIFALFLPLGRVKLYFLKVNNKYVACQYCLSYKEKVYDYLKGFDANLPRALSPGFLLLVHSIEDSIKLGKKKFDFFKGSKKSYKYRWTDKERFVSTIRVVSQNNFKNRLYCFIKITKSLVKKATGRGENVN